MTIKQVRKKGFISLILLHHCSSLMEIRIESQAGQEVGGRSYHSGHKEGCCLLV